MHELTKYIEKVIRRENLSHVEAARSFQMIMNGGATPVQMGALLVALRMKGETIEEIVGAATVMRSKAGKINAPEGSLDTCGTGGDSSGSYNISTTVAFIVAACGVPVAKHGNRSISSKSGSADVLRELGVNLDADVSLMEQAINEANICFMMAPKFHSAMRHVAPVRQELSVRTIFNILGPLSNPAAAKYQLLGVYSKKWIEPLAHVLKELGTKSAWVVHGSDGMDEITTTGISYVASLKNEEIVTFKIDPEDYGIEIVESQALKGGDAAHNARELREVLLGRGSDAYRDIALLNAAASLVVAEKAKDINKGLKMATKAIKTGAANDALLKLVEISNL